MESILHGIRVLDFGCYLAGPFCAALLGNLGAEAIRIDKVAGSEDRFIMPVGGADGEIFLRVNRNKRSLTLNLSAPQGRKIVRRLVARSDVFVANMPPATLKSAGLDYDT